MATQGTNKMKCLSHYMCGSPIVEGADLCPHCKANVDDWELEGSEQAVKQTQNLLQQIYDVGNSWRHFIQQVISDYLEPDESNERQS